MIICFLLLGIAIVLIDKYYQEDGMVLVSIPINNIVEKSADEDYYFLTVVLDDFFIEECSLPYSKLRLSAKKSIYEQVVINSGYVGATLFVPNYETRDEFVTMIKEQNVSNWKIVELTTNANDVIQ